MQNKLLGQLFLVLAALFWGIAFVAQSDAAGKIGTFSFLFLRFLLGALVLLPVIWLQDKKEERKTGQKKPFLRSFFDKELLKAGLFCGLAVCGASTCQQMGLANGTTPGKAAFITTMYMIFVPIVGLFLHRKAPKLVWIGVALATVGMYFLCIKGAVTLCFGDLLVFFCSIANTVHILVLDHFVNKVDCLRLSCLQFLTASVYGLLVMLPTETLTGDMILDALIPILYVGFISSGVAYTLQVVGQKYCPAVIAPLLMSLESVFAALAGWAFGVEHLSAAELIGCALIFAAVLLVQVPTKEPN